LLKATQLLVGAGEHHMTKECAWYRFRNLHPNENGRHEEDWSVAEPHILDLIHSTGNPRVRSH
jgi:hypothetical protein